MKRVKINWGRPFPKVVYPRVVQFPLRFSFDSQGYFTSVPGGGHIAHPSNSHKLDIADFAGQGKSPDNWRHLVFLGQNATSNHSGRKSRFKFKDGVSAYLYPNGTVDVISGYIQTAVWAFGDPPGGLTKDVSADNQARARLLDAYLKLKNTWRGGNFLVEIRETIELLKHPVKAFYHRTYEFARTVERLGKVYKLQPLKKKKALANAWLAYVFGVKPLVNDANDLATALYKLGQSSFDRVKLYAKGKSESATNTRTSVNWSVSGHPNVNQQVDITIKDNSEVKYRGAIKRPPMDSNLIIQQFGVGVFDVIPAVWEAIPWSFFIDYFINVQEVLDGMRFVEADLAWLYQAYRNARVRRVSSPIYNGGFVAGGRWTGTGGDGWSLCVMHKREALTTMPYPNFYFRVPGLTSLKWLNIAALSQQIRNSGRRFITH